MSGSTRSAIPVTDRNLVSRLREIVPNYGDDEIYAILKECNKDPDETVQRLLNEGKFYTVKRKREKKREAANSKDLSDTRLSGSSLRGGRNSGGFAHGVGREIHAGQANTSSKVPLQENGATISKMSSCAPGILSYSQLVQPKPVLKDHENFSFLPANADQSSSLEGMSWPASLGTVAPTTLQGAWLVGPGRGQGTIVDVLKASDSSCKANTPVLKVQGDNDLQSSSSFPPISTRAIPSSCTDALSSEANSSLVPFKQGVLPEDMGHHANGSTSFPVNNLDIVSSTSGSLSCQHEAGQQDLCLEQQSCQLESIGPSSILMAAPLQSSTINQYNCSPVHHAESLDGVIDTDQAEDEVSSGDAADAPSDGELGFVARSYLDSVSAAAAKLQELTVQDQQSVIIPDHLRVSTADCSNLSFGSFELGIGSLSPGLRCNGSATPSMFGDCGVNDVSVTVSESVSTARSVVSSTWEHHVVNDVSTNPLEPVSLVSGSTTSGLEHNTEVLLPVQNVVLSTSSTVIDDSVGSKPKERCQEPYFSAQSSYMPVSLPISNQEAQHVPPSQETQCVSEQSGSRMQDATHLSSILPYPDPPASATYYGGVFRSSTDLDVQYSAFLPSGKFGVIPPSGHDQSAVFQEGCNNSVFPSSTTVAPTFTCMNVPSVQQQSLPVHAYATQPSAVHLSPYANVLGYHHYMPPGFNYLQNYYQQNIGNTLKYAMPQHKQSASMNLAVQNTVRPGATGYSGYAGTQQGYPPVSVTYPPNFDKISTQYNDSSLYIPTHQVEMSPNWVEASLPQDVPGGPFYNNIHAQNQPARYPQVQSMNAHSVPGATAFSNLYRPQQSVSTPSVQLQQALGSVSALGTQIGSYHQGKRGQQSWTNGF